MLARWPQAAGVAMVTVHGRTREQGYTGQAEYDTIAAVKAALRIPVVANGDIDSPEKAREVLADTGADALMIGRAAQGRPWIFREIAHFLATGEHLAAPDHREVARWLAEHLHDHYGLYGEASGVRSARKHIGWAVRALPGGEAFRAEMNRIDDCATQLAAVHDYFDQLAERHHTAAPPRHDRWPARPTTTSTRTRAHEQRSTSTTASATAWSSTSRTCAAPSRIRCTTCSSPRSRSRCSTW